MANQLRIAMVLLFSVFSVASADTSLLSSHLQSLQHDYANYQGPASFTSSDATLNVLNANRVMLTITSTVEEAPLMIQKLEALGMTHISHYKHLVAGVLPISQLTQVESVQGVHWVSSQRAIANSSGLANNAGDASMFTDVVRKQQGVDGSGVTIGIMSDSYNCLQGEELDIALGDLPNNVQVIKEYSFCEQGAADEGRAMMQLIHDIAPGARLLFYSAFESPVNFAQGIITLADHGANIIVDDIGWLAMPMVQEGPIAQAVNEVEQRGVVYFSAAGNNARLPYQQAFKKTVATSGALAHDFGLAAGKDSDIYQKITLPQDVAAIIVLQWDDASSIAGGKGAQTDLDLFLFDSANNRLIASSEDNNIGHDPVEIIAVKGEEGEAFEGGVFIRKSAGKDPLYVKYVIFSSGGATELINHQELNAEQLHFNELGELVTETGGTIEAGISVVIVPDYSGEFAVNSDFLQIGLGGAPIITNQNDGQRGILLDNNYYPIDRPIWFIPDGFSAQLNNENEIVIIDESAEVAEQTDVRIAEYDTRSSTIYGHPNAAGAIAVGAMSYRQSPWFNGNADIERFSSAGGLPVIFDTAGELLSQIELRPKPEIIAIDDIDTTFFPFIAEETDTDQNELPNFLGTSAAAPNAAAVAALLLEKYAYLKPAQVKQIMMQGTIDLNDPAQVQGEFELAYNPCASDVTFDWGTGCGLIQADRIFEVAKDFELRSDLGDLNNDGCVDVKDTDILTAILRSSGEVQEEYDLTGDGQITERDFDALLGLYGNGCSG